MSSQRHPLIILMGFLFESYTYICWKIIFKTKVIDINGLLIEGQDFSSLISLFVDARYLGDDIRLWQLWWFLRLLAYCSLIDITLEPTAKGHFFWQTFEYRYGSKTIRPQTGIVLRCLFQKNLSLYRLNCGNKEIDAKKIVSQCCGKCAFVQSIRKMFVGFYESFHVV